MIEEYKEGVKAIYTGGTFEVPHAGHANFFKQISSLFPEYVVLVSLNTDDFIEEYKGKKPLYTLSEREKLVSYLFPSNMFEVMVNEYGADSASTIDQVRNAGYYDIDLIAIGNDWLQKDYCKQMNFTAQWLTDRNIALMYFPHSDGISTTDIKKRINWNLPDFILYN